MVSFNGVLNSKGLANGCILKGDGDFTGRLKISTAHIVIVRYPQMKVIYIPSPTFGGFCCELCLNVLPVSFSLDVT